MNNDDNTNELSEDELALKLYVNKVKKLIWTWIIGSLVIMICIMLGDVAQWLLAAFVAVYIFISTVNYFK